MMPAAASTIAMDDHDTAAGRMPPPYTLVAMSNHNEMALSTPGGGAMFAPLPSITPSPAPFVGGQDSDEEGSYPFFNYKDRSRDQDPDPLYPLVPPGRVPNFPAKMHAILSRSDLQHVVRWLPHGRSWQILKPREFEIQVIPQYFEHTKYSSFVRQANGWGFRRFTQGPDRNSYYHPKFLRGLPHLCKTMKRQPQRAATGAKKGRKSRVSVDATKEPDFYKISELYPVPEKSADESIVLASFVQEGKVRMPIYCGTQQQEQQQQYQYQQYQKILMIPTSTTSAGPGGSVIPTANDAMEGAYNTVKKTDPAAMIPPPASVVSCPSISAPAPAAAPSAGSAAAAPCQPTSWAVRPGETQPQVELTHPSSAMMLPHPPSSTPPSPSTSPVGATTSCTNTSSPPLVPLMMTPWIMQQSPQLATNEGLAASHFAAGFAAAAAFSQQHFAKVLESMIANTANGNPRSGGTGSTAVQLYESMVANISNRPVDV